MAFIISFFEKTLDRPLRFSIICLSAALCGLLLDGTLFNLKTLVDEKARMQLRLTETLKINDRVEAKIHQAKTSDQFIAKQARDKLDLLKKDEIVFIFENDEMQPPLLFRNNVSDTAGN